MANIGIVGSGNVGANTAFFLAEKNVADALVYDVKEGLSTGKTLDMMEAAAVRGYQRKLSGTDSLEDVLASEIIVIAAGTFREPGQKRDDLFDANKGLIEELGGKLKGHSGVVIVATEPVDALTTLFVKRSGLPRERVIGVGGVLDATRLRYLLAGELKVGMADVAATVIGTHNDHMVPLKDYTTVGGIPVKHLLPDPQITALFDATRRAGDELLATAQRTSAYYGPAAAVCDIAEAIVGDTNRVLSVSFVLDGELGVSGVAASLPAAIGTGGIKRVMLPKVADGEKKQFADGTAAVAQILEGSTK